VKSIYNKRREDFTTLREYNDYLEEVQLVFAMDVLPSNIAVFIFKVEEITLRLINKEREEETFLQMKKYQLENEAIIKKNHKYV
jgi:CDK-activating kinase assembly factor MAT1